MRTLEEILGDSLDISAFLVQAQLDYKFFGEHVLGLDVQPYQAFWIDSFESKRRSCFTAPRGSGKTYALGVAFPIWKSAFNRDLKFLITAASKDRAKDIVTELRNTIDRNELLSEILTPQGKATSWSTQGLRTKTDCQINVRAFTAKGIRGQHVDYALLDEGGEITDHQLYFSSFVPTVTQRGGKIVVIGTPQSEVDLLSILHEEERGYFCRTYSMWDEETQTSLWPSKFPKNELDKLRAEQGLMNFRREYLCEMVDEGAQPFPLTQVVSTYDPDEGFENLGRYYQVVKGNPEAWGEYYIGVDLALSPQGDYTVFTVVERLGTQLIIRNIHRIRGIDYHVQADLGKQLYESFKPRGMLVDKSNFGEPFVNDLREMGVPADTFKFTADNRNLILNNLVRIVTNTFHKGGTPTMIIPRRSQDEICLTETATLTDELQKFIFDKTPAGFRTFRSTAKHDDTVMSLALAIYAATQFSDAKNVTAFVSREPETSHRNVYLGLDESFLDPFTDDIFASPY